MLRIAWIGFHREGLPALQALLEQGTRVEAVITLKEEQLAKRSGAADYGDLTRHFGVPLYRVANINNPESVRLLTELSLDIAFVLGWSEIIRPPALQSCRIGMIGAHASLLPHNRGSAPINWALIRGEKQAGNTLLWLADDVDSGDIIDQVGFPIANYDTCQTLYDKVAESNREMVLRLVPRLLKGERPGRPQAPSNGLILSRRRPEHGRIDWSRDGQSVYDFIRALTRPYPGAFSYLDGTRWLIWQSALFPAGVSAGSVVGEVLGPVISPVGAACGQAVACGQGAVIVLEVEGENGLVLRGQELSDQVWRGKVWTNEHA
jgi:methionyl-tRNA formyltransferase